MPHMALVATAGSDSIITDSANAASAYATGHKTAVNAMGVYADRTASPFDDPKVETITSLAKRRHGMGIGIVTNTEVEDATPAAMVAHTRRRAAYDEIVEQFFAARPDVLMGGGARISCRKPPPGSKRKDDVDYVARFRDAGYSVATTKTELDAVNAKSDTRQLLGLFATGNMDGALDRKFLKGGGVKKFPDQPDLTEQVQAALNVLSKNEAGFFLMVESGLIDKYAHLLDMERAVYDTIMLDNAVRLARDWAQARGDDTLILVIADHNHPNSLVGTINDDMSTTPNVPLRERVGVYEKAGFPNYPAPDADGYPSRVDVSRRLAIFSASLPDHYETFRPKLDNPERADREGRRGRNVQGQRKIQGCSRRRAALRQSAGDDGRQRAFGRRRHPDRDRAGQRTGSRFDGQYRCLPRHGGRARPRRRGNSFAQAFLARQESDGAANISLTQLRKIRICRSRRLGSFSVFDMMMAPSTMQDSMSATSSRSTGSLGG